MAFGALQTLAAELKSDIVGGLQLFNHNGKPSREVFKNSTGYNVSLRRLPINFNSLENS